MGTVNSSCTGCETCTSYTHVKDGITTSLVDEAGLQTFFCGPLQTFRYSSYALYGIYSRTPLQRTPMGPGLTVRPTGVRSFAGVVVHTNRINF